MITPMFGDFCLEKHFVFQVGGRNKKINQIKNIPNSYVLAADILSVDNNKIPIWLLGFL
jgi:hypothetical protein